MYAASKTDYFHQVIGLSIGAGLQVEQLAKVDTESKFYLINTTQPASRYPNAYHLLSSISLASVCSFHIFHINEIFPSQVESYLSHKLLCVFIPVPSS